MKKRTAKPAKKRGLIVDICRLRDATVAVVLVDQGGRRVAWCSEPDGDLGSMTFCEGPPGDAEDAARRFAKRFGLRLGGRRRWNFDYDAEIGIR